MTQNKEKVIPQVESKEFIRGQRQKVPGIQMESMEESKKLFEAMKKSYEKETGKDFEEWVNSIDID